MKSIKQLFRLFQINYILAKNGFDNLLVTIKLFAPIRFIIYLNPWNWLRKEKLTPGEALRISLEELGPIFIKFGQALSTRPDILPVDIAKELKKLQDKVPPFDSEIALKIIEASLGGSAYDIFAQFDSQPLASASISQVHAARLHSGEEVVVKVLRPKIERTIERDISILHTIANLLNRYWPESQRLKPKEIVDEFEMTLFNELDLAREAGNAAQLRRNFANSHLLYVPEIYWDYIRPNILVTERIHGIPITDLQALDDYHIDKKKLAERGVEIFFTQVFRDSFFHADMHPGNIFVSKSNPTDPQYISVDFGIIGSLNDKDKRYLAENFYAFFNRDYRRVAELHVESGWVDRNTRIGDFEAAIRTVLEPNFEKPLKHISLAKVVINLFQTASRFNMEVQPQLVLLQKTFLAVEGLGKQLYPDLNLWNTAKPFLEKWLKEQVGPQALIQQIKKNIPFFAEQLPHFPKLIYDVLELSKREKVIRKELQLKQEKQFAHDKKANNIAKGAFIAFLSVTVLTYVIHFDQREVSLLALLGTGLSGAIALFYNNKRS